MKEQLEVVLSGLGYYKLSVQRRKQIAVIAASSLVVHLVALLAFGSWVVIRALREEQTVFVAPPPMKTYQPRQLEHRVKVQKRQRSSSRPSIRPRMVAMKPSQFALPEIKPTSPTVSPRPITASISGWRFSFSRQT